MSKWENGREPARCFPAAAPGRSPAHHRRRAAERRLTEAILHRLLSGDTISDTAIDTGLPDGSVDAVTIAEAYHCFDNERTRMEQRRILKPGGHVFLLWNRFTGNPWDQARADLSRRYRTAPHRPQRTGDQRADDLFGPGRWQRNDSGRGLPGGMPGIVRPLRRAGAADDPHHHRVLHRNAPITNRQPDSPMRKAGCLFHMRLLHRQVGECAILPGQDEVAGGHLSGGFHRTGAAHAAA